jgi:tRNA (guanine37-N1)-methyltransferase
MHQKVTIDTSPPPARWMKGTLVQSAFHRTVPVVAVRLPAAKAGIVLKAQPMRG